MKKLEITAQEEECPFSEFQENGKTPYVRCIGGNMFCTIELYNKKSDWEKCLRYQLNTEVPIEEY